MFLRTAFIAIILCTLGLMAQAAGNGYRDPNNKTVFSDKLRADNPAKQTEMRQKSLTWRKFEERNGHWYVAFNAFTGIPMRAAGGPVPILGETPQSQALYFINNELKGFGIPTEDLKFEKNTRNDKYSYVLFSQTYKGLPVWGGNFNVRITPAQKVVGFTANVYPDIALQSLVPQLSAETVSENVGNSMLGTYVCSTQPQLKVLPIPTAQGYTYKLVYAFELTGTDTDGHTGRYSTLADANDATVYYCHNKIVYNNLEAHGTVEEQETDFTIQAPITDFPYSPTQVRALPFMRFRINNVDYFTDATGHLTYDGTTPVSATAYLQGPYARVYRNVSGNTVPSFQVTIDAVSPEVTLTVAAADISAFAGYYHTITQYKHQKLWLPSDFTAFDNSPMTVRVDRTDGDCNAFYDGNINFYAEANGCNATARVSDVVYHEFGHGINYEFYNYLGGTFENGALGEGYSDIWGMHITQNPVLGPGFFTGGLNESNYVRRYDINKKVYPQDLVGEVHADGEIICGAWWDLGQYIGIDTMFALFIASHYGVPMRPDGEEGLLYADILFEALMADDDNGNISDGTPHSNEIIQAFDEHGISLIISAIVEHYELPLFMANQDIPLEIGVEIDFNYEQFLENVSVFWRTDESAAYTAIPAVELSTNAYTATIPSQSAGTIIDYYVQLQSTAGGGPIVPFLANAAADPNLPYQLLVGYQILQTETFADGTGEWTLGVDDDDASTGYWEIDSPNSSFIAGGGQVQTGEDFSPASDNYCAFTGNAGGSEGAGANDVDDGKTTLISPTIDLANKQNPAIGYYRWFTNDQGANPGNDPWEVFISNNDGTDWVAVENTYTADHSWRFNAIKVSDYVEPTPHVRLMFVASDVLISGLEFDGGSLVEGAIDDVTVYDLAPPVGIETVSGALQATVYPNPANDKLYLNAMPQLPTLASVRLYDSSGREVYSGTNIGLQSAGYTIPTAQLSAGVYMLLIDAGGVLVRQKVVVRH